MQKQTVGIAFSGGAARGIAHLGVLQALLELNIPIKVISGTSSGAIAGAFYAAGFQPKEVLGIIKQVNVVRLLRPAFSWYGLMNLDEVEKVITKYLGDLSFEDLKTELIITATDINQGNVVYFTSGKIIKPLIASCSVPLVYKPIEYQNHVLLDGGLLNNMPVECLMDRCDFIIGSHCNPLNYEAKVSTFKTILERTFQLAINSNVQQRFKYCDVLIEPPELKHFSLLSYSRADEFFQIGYDYTMNLAEKLEVVRQAPQTPDSE